MLSENIIIFKKTLNELIKNRESIVYKELAESLKFKVGRKSQFKKWIIPLYLEICLITDCMCNLVSMRDDSYTALDLLYKRMEGVFSVDIYKMDSGFPAYRVSVSSIRQQFKVNDLAGFKDDYVRYRQTQDSTMSQLVLLPGELVSVLGFIEDYFNTHKLLLIETFDLDSRYKKYDYLNEQVFLDVTSMFKNRIEIANRFPNPLWSEHYDELIATVRAIKNEIIDKVLLSSDGTTKVPAKVVKKV